LKAELYADKLKSSELDFKHAGGLSLIISREKSYLTIHNFTFYIIYDNEKYQIMKDKHEIG
jgi:hypothetical protein